MIWSDHGTDFVGAIQELKEVVEFLNQQKVQGIVSEFCSSQKNHEGIHLDQAPSHFVSLWEVVVKSMMTHLKTCFTDVELNYEEFITVLAQIEACL